MTSFPGLELIPDRIHAIRSRNVGRQMAVVETWMEVRRLAFPIAEAQTDRKQHNFIFSNLLTVFLF